jgi:hypothetical protein
MEHCGLRRKSEVIVRDFKACNMFGKRIEEETKEL